MKYIVDNFKISLLFFYGGISTVFHSFFPYFNKNKMLEYKRINYCFETNKDTSG